MRKFQKKTNSSRNTRKSFRSNLNDRRKDIPSLQGAIILLIFLLLPLLSYSQPQGFNYQALVRDGSGNALPNEQVSLRISLVSDSTNGTQVYQETHTPTTSAYGNVNVVVGQGSAASGIFSSIDWLLPMYLRVELDAAGGTNYTDLGTVKLMSVPYALYAGQAASAPADADSDPDNEIQTLSLSNDTVFLSDGGQVKLPPGGGTPDEIRDADGDTRVSMERSPDEDIIRFDVGGTERMRLRGSALEFVNTGGSVFLGDSAGANDDGSTNQNTFVGLAAGYSNTTGIQNTFAGWRAGYNNTQGLHNTFAGWRSGYNNTTGSHNAFSGTLAGYLNTTGSHNTFVGTAAGYSNTTGIRNTSIGYWAGYYNTGGNYNTLVGYRAGYNSTGGSQNTFSGTMAGYNNTTGNDNTYLGYHAGPASTAAGDDTGNVFIGYYAGYNTALAGSDQLVIANSTDATPLIHGNFATDSLTINGHLRVTEDLTVNGSQIINGDLTVAGTFSNLSDVRLKKNIAPLTDALDGLDKLKGVYYEFADSRGGDYPKGRQIGVIAQEVETVYPELVKTDEKGFKSVGYSKLTAVLIEAVKELSAKNAELEVSNKKLQQDAATGKEENRNLKSSVDKVNEENRELKKQMADIASRMETVEALLLSRAQRENADKVAAVCR